MTIGIVACGDNAGVAAITSLGSIEHVADGAIGGFVSLVVMDSNNKATFFECQEGGINALFGNTNCVIDEESLPLEVIESKRVGLISSGPHRPCPLTRFLAWDEHGTIVSGHRFPQSPTRDGIALNQSLLSIIQQHGAHSPEVLQLLSENNHLDAGIVAVDATNRLFCEDTERVRARNDTARIQRQAKDFAFGITMNSIQPSKLVVEILASKLDKKLQQSSLSADSPRISINLQSRILEGSVSMVQVDSKNHVMSVITPETCWFEQHNEGALLETGTSIYRDGQIIGTILEEPYTTTSHGKICALSGLDKITLRYRACVVQAEYASSLATEKL